MVCQPFKCVQQCYAPSNPCGVYMSNAYLRVANLYCQNQFGSDNKAGTCWVCDCNCKVVDYKAPRCCKPCKPQKCHFQPKYPSCHRKCGHGYGHH